jgi:hypothetical protein
MQSSSLRAPPQEDPRRPQSTVPPVTRQPAIPTHRIPTAGLVGATDGPRACVLGTPTPPTRHPVTAHAAHAPAATATADAAAAAAAAAATAVTLQVTVNPAGPGNKAFNTLARYIFGDNRAAARMAMTTPVYSDTTGTMRFVIGPTAVKVRHRTRGDGAALAPSRRGTVAARRGGTGRVLFRVRYAGHGCSTGISTRPQLTDGRTNAQVGTGGRRGARERAAAMLMKPHVGGLCIPGQPRAPGSAPLHQGASAVPAPRSLAHPPSNTNECPPGRVGLFLALRRHRRPRPHRRCPRCRRPTPRPCRWRSSRAAWWPRGCLGGMRGRTTPLGRPRR